jgi:hypothetical protein
MAIQLERFSIFKAPIQGPLLHDLVAQESDWLKEVFPGTVQRYRNKLHAAKNVARIAHSEGMRAFIIKEEKVARGIATIIFEQTVIHPTEGEFTGNDLDYWLASDATTDMHNNVAFKLMIENGHIDNARRGGYLPTDPFGGRDLSVKLAGPHPIMGTIVDNQQHPPIGLGYVMSPVGDPAVLRTPDGTDPYGLTKDGAEVQLYERNIIRLRQLFPPNQT